MVSQRKQKLIALFTAFLLLCALPLQAFAVDAESQEEQSIFDGLDLSGSQEGETSEHANTEDDLNIEEDPGVEGEEEANALAEEEAQEEEPAAPAPKQHSDPRAQILNSLELNPTNPGSADLDALLDEIMAEIITDDMDTYEQLRACYDYIVENTRYGSAMGGMGARIGNTTCRQIYSRYGSIEGFGAMVLVTHQGQCNAYASAFILMARKIGVEIYLVKGSTRRAGGGYMQHQWAEMTINGTRYLFDPQLEQDLAHLGAHSNFCVTYNSLPNRYVR